ncbi:MAG: histidine triad nucleotide-binding protein [Chloroflexota bacterium]|jgi:histidine triad (HIT) family protein|nr:histidine triad nucleotide-binding protein [Chloroflexota bacterium]MDP6508916.1 histidine triad nucleotide-binding protein [Chloroflexota bacterium]MDP6757683.1 histidine triad nucleotide-binding protein [Chloroflexota bacterium]
MSCIFCGIAAGEVPSDTVAEGEDFVAFRDLQPQAATHVLVIPRRHISGIADIIPKDGDLIGRLMVAAADVARGEGLAEGGYRLVVNQGEAGGQTVEHLHIHVLGGRQMRWPPG